jgi:ABC-type uncharacterized transport system substrate-binding protein
MKYFLFSLLLVLPLLAHPHFFINSSINLKSNVICHTWTFDRLNSRLLIFEFDKNKNNIFEDKEQKAFLEAHFFSLKASNYNIFIQNDDKEIEINPQAIHVKIKNKKVVLEFITSISLKENSVFCTIDATLYSAYNLTNIQSVFKTDIQKSKYDFCIGVVQ